MKIKFAKLLSLLLAAVLLAGAIPMSAIGISAEETEDKKAEEVTEQIAPDASYAGYKPYKELPQMSEGTIAGIYKDGVLVYEEKADEKKTAHELNVFTVAVEQYAPALGELSDAEIKDLPEVRIVLNTDFVGTLAPRQSGSFCCFFADVKFVLDLNGHLLSLKAEESGLFYALDSHITIIDSNPTVPHTGTVTDGRWMADEEGTTTIFGGVITTHGENGRGFALHGTTLTMKGGTLAGFDGDFEGKDTPYGESTHGSYGGAVLVEGNATLAMEGPAGICYNVAYRGAGVLFTGKDSELVGNGQGRIYGNTAYSYGGGVNFYKGGGKVEGVIIENNVSSKEGGGIAYRLEDAKDSLTIKNCIIRGNYSGTRGGGIAVFSEGMTLDSSTITANYSKEHGGGVLVKPNKHVTVAGTLVIRDNVKANYGEYKTEADKSNLYLQGNNDLVVGTLYQGAAIWIRSGKSADDYNGVNHTLTKGSWDGYTNTSPAFFYSDNPKYYVEHQRDKTKKNYFNLYLKEGTRPTYAFVDTLTAEEARPVEDGTYTVTHEFAKPDGSTEEISYTYPMIRGYFQFNMKAPNNFFSLSPFYYSDGFFALEPSKYSASLATMSANMAFAAFGRKSSYIEDNEYANHFANVKQLMSDIGCPDENFYANDFYQVEPEFFGENADTLSTIGAAISHKTLTVGDKEYILMPIAIRGGGYGAEWASNVTIGSEGEAKGFSDAAHTVYDNIQGYLEAYDLTDRAEAGEIKFWVVGYSRAGATANLTSKYLIDNYAKAGNHIYGYTFEAPMGGLKSEIVKADYTDDGKYLSIHNTVNENDFVPLVAPAQMGFIRYGVDHLIGGDYENDIKVENKNSGEYWERRQKMIAQLAAINPYYAFDDYWDVADLNPVLSNLPSWLTNGAELIDVGEQWYDDPNEEAKNVYTFLRWFFERVQKDGLWTNDEDKFREYYSSRAPLKDVGWYWDEKDATLPHTDKNHFFGNSEMSVEDAVQTLMGLMYSLPSDKKDAIIKIVMENVSDLGLGGKFGVYWEILFRFNEHTVDWCADNIDDLLHKLLKSNKYGSVWDVLTYEQGAAVADALPVLVYFLACYASEDYDEGWLDDDGMWGVGTFVFNMNRLLSNHYQEVTLAWVRSNDMLYTTGELQAYMLEEGHTTDAPKGGINLSTGTLTLEAESGSSIFYSVDGGANWILYTKPVTLAAGIESVKTFSVHRGAQSAEITVGEELTGSIFSDGAVVFLIAGSVVVLGAAVTSVVILRKRKKKAI